VKPVLGIESNRARHVCRALAILGSPTWARTRDLRINGPLWDSARRKNTRSHWGSEHTVLLDRKRRTPGWGFALGHAALCFGIALIHLSDLA